MRLGGSSWIVWLCAVHVSLVTGGLTQRTHEVEDTTVAENRITSNEAPKLSKRALQENGNGHSLGNPRSKPWTWIKNKIKNVAQKRRSDENGQSRIHDGHVTLRGRLESFSFRSERPEKQKPLLPKGLRQHFWGHPRARSGITEEQESPPERKLPPQIIEEEAAAPRRSGLSLPGSPPKLTKHLMIEKGLRSSSLRSSQKRERDRMDSEAGTTMSSPLRRLSRTMSGQPQPYPMEALTRMPEGYSSPQQKGRSNWLSRLSRLSTVSSTRGTHYNTDAKRQDEIHAGASITQKEQPRTDSPPLSSLDGRRDPNHSGTSRASQPFKEYHLPAPPRGRGLPIGNWDSVTPNVCPFPIPLTSSPDFRPDQVIIAHLRVPQPTWFARRAPLERRDQPAAVAADQSRLGRQSGKLETYGR